MTQTTGGFSRAKAFIEVSINNSDWTACGGVITTLSLSGAEQHVGQINTLSGQAPVVTNANKYTATEISVEALYTEESAELWEIVYARWKSATQTIYFRFAPQGDVSGVSLFTCADDAGTTALVPIVNCLPPDSDAGSGEAAMFSLDLITPKLAESANVT